MFLVTSVGSQEPGIQCLGFLFLCLSNEKSFAFINSFLKMTLAFWKWQLIGHFYVLNE